MKNAFRIVAIALVIAAGVWVFRVLFPGDEKLIRKLLAQAADAAAVKSNENPIFKLAGANKLVGFFSPDALLKVDLPGAEMRSISGRDDLLQAITAARAGLLEAKIQLHEVHVNVDAGGQAASAQLVTTAYLNGNGDPLVEELKMQLKKIDGYWKIAQLETVKSLGM